ncbi:MAG: ACT domain-containing protein [Limisphaerales bacterium]|jgi:hypothetical protein
MNLIVERADVWAAPLQDRPGGLADVLETLKDAGADLDFIVARRDSKEPGKGVAFVTPLRGDAEVAAAAEVGFNVANSIHSVRIEGANERGLAAELVRRLADEGINLRSLSAAELGARFVMYIGFDTEQDAKKAVALLLKDD